jgi:hypothetical protein
MASIAGYCGCASCATKLSTSAQGVGLRRAPVRAMMSVRSRVSHGRSAGSSRREIMHAAAEAIQPGLPSGDGSPYIVRKARRMAYGMNRMFKDRHVQQED